ncbi:Branched-chain amino acid aminotransferase OS=Ureibacillus acetophenoni OX=614649 GN=SAMN05877842_10210 PE=4 SV=1 [Ureibacillus acetophenoni]
MNLHLSEVIIERCDKETEDVLSSEQLEFLSTPLQHVKKHPNEFIYIESPTFDQIKVDAISIELDDVFQTYTALLGLRMQKKYTAAIKNYFNENLIGENKYFSASFSGDEGIWDLNIPLDYIQGFSEEMTIGDALSLTYEFVTTLVKDIEQQ